MADLDSTSKRRSSVQVLLPFASAPPDPDGDLDQGDRQHAAMSYSGVLAGAAVTPPPVVVSGGGWRQLRVTQPRRTPEFVSIIASRGIGVAVVSTPALSIIGGAAARAIMPATASAAALNVIAGAKTRGALAEVATVPPLMDVVTLATRVAHQRHLDEQDELVLLGL